MNEKLPQPGDVFDKRRVFGIDEIALGLEIIVAARNVRNFISNNSVAGVFEIIPGKTGGRKKSKSEKNQTNNYCR